MEYVFWISIAIVFYTFLGYGLVISLLASFSKKAAVPFFQDSELPEVTLLIAAYNEADILDAKIQNALALDYPTTKLHIQVVTDGSSDDSGQVLAKYSQVTVHHSAERKGKIAAVNRVMPLIKTDFTVFCDANVLLNSQAIRELVKHFRRPEVAAVSGEKVVLSQEADTASAAGEGFYWKYESFLKRKDAEWNTLVGSAGELFAIRTGLYAAPDTNTLIEDFVLTVKLATQGHVVAYEPNAIASETASANVEEEYKRKVRISAGGIQAIGLLPQAMQFWKHPGLTFQYISHRVLRWTLMPLALILILISNVFLAIESDFFAWVLVAQAVFYGLGLIGYLRRNSSIKLKAFHLPFYFVFMQVCVIMGWIKFARGKQQVTWEKSKRMAMQKPD